MSVLGLFILIASFSFICYRCPPSSWLILQWLRRPSITLSSKQSLHNAPTIQLPEIQEEREEEVVSATNGSAGSNTSPRIEEEASATKQDLDRKAMPPPPLPFKKPLPPTSKPSSLPTPDSPPTPRGPFFNIADSKADTEPSIPSFPALNSAQRASGGIRGPPRLNAVQPTPGAGLMPPPQRSSLPNRGPPTSSSLFPPPTHTSIPTKPRRKVLLTPGHSPLDWARLSSSPNANLSGLPTGTPYLRVPPSLLKTMTGREGKDAWTVLGGKVYNITPYAPYHPGGEPELMKAAGRDGTRLFGEVHPWVNWEGMLEGCLVGVAVEEGDVVSLGKMEEMD